MAPRDLEAIMTDFYDNKFDVLLSTTIVESGLDIPTANTLIVHRADRFGLGATLSVARASQAARKHVPMPCSRSLPRNRSPLRPNNALKFCSRWINSAPGFELASHDLDIRGAGNLLGDEQSGHIREVGYELYQEMLEEAVMMLKAGVDAPASDKWSPQINVGTPVMIPEEYVPDLAVRLGLYRRLADMDIGIGNRLRSPQKSSIASVRCRTRSRRCSKSCRSKRCAARRTSPRSKQARRGR